MFEQTGPFRRIDRLLDSRDFRRVLRRGRRQGGRDLVVFTVARDSKGAASSLRAQSASPGEGVSRSRLGITASRKVGNAVIRNRFKRRTREWFRMRRRDFPIDMDLVVIARPAAAKLSLEELDERLSQLIGLPSLSNRRNQTP